MRLSEIAKPKMILEGGNAFEGVGTIHISEIEPTLDAISRATDLSDIVSKTLGSVGKKEYSGDIDIGIEPKDPEEMKEFIDSLERVYGQTGVRKIGQLITTKVPIEGYDPSKDERQPRTGFVQVDYMFGNPEWMKFVYHSPYEKDSKMKGVHRHLAMASLARTIQDYVSDEEDEFGRPVERTSYKWSGAKNGLVKTKQTSRQNARTGKTIKKQDEEIVEDPIKNAEGIAEVLFRGKAGAEYLDSAESVIAGAQKAYSPQELEKIFSSIARAFISYDKGKEYDYPEELGPYIEQLKLEQ